MSHAIRGVHSAVTTPVDSDGSPLPDLMIAHCRALLDEGCHGLSPIGTTGEANSLGLSQRMALLEALIDGGLDASVLAPGTGTPSASDTIALTRHAVRAGCKAAMLLPPYYYKDVSVDGLYRHYAQVIEGVGDDRLRLMLYHIPQTSIVGIPHDLIDRLMTDFPGIVCAIKDSSGDLSNMVAMCERFPDLSVLTGADVLFWDLLKAGGAGCITGVSNLRSDALRFVWDNWQDPAQAEAVGATMARLKAWRDLAQSFPQLPATKSMVARARGDDRWHATLPPLDPLTDAQCAALYAGMDALD